MFKLSILLVFSVILAACSLYKSESRKSFESHAQATLPLQSLQINSKLAESLQSRQLHCDEVSDLQYWYDTRFPSPRTEWVESGSENLEVWQTEDESGAVHVRSYEQTPPSITRCQISFRSKADWRQFQSFYFKSLEGAHL